MNDVTAPLATVLRPVGHPTKLFPEDFRIEDSPPTIPLQQTKGNNTLAHLNADTHYSGIILMVEVDDKGRHGLFQVLGLTQVRVHMDVFVDAELFDPLVGVFAHRFHWWQKFVLYLGQP